MHEKTVEAELLAAEVAPQVLGSLRALLAELYMPMLASQDAAAAAAGGRQPAGSAARKQELLQVSWLGA